MQESLLSEWCSPIWPRSGMTRSGLAYELPTWALLTAGSDGSASGPSHLLPTPSASDSTGAEGATRKRQQQEGDTGGPSLRDLPKLLPTPVATDAFGSRRSTARTEEWTSNPGTSLTDAIWETQGRETDTTGKLLPIPTGDDANNTTRDSGEFQSLAREAHRLVTDGRLLPTPTTQDGENNAGPSQRVRNSDPLNVVAADLAAPLLPTPSTRDHHAQGAGMNAGASQTQLSTVVQKYGMGGIPEESFTTRPTSADQMPLLPTPKVTASRASRHAMVEIDQWSAPSLEQAIEIANGVLPREFKSWDEVPGRSGNGAPTDQMPLLPTPETVNRKSRKAMTSSTDNGRRSGGGELESASARADRGAPGRSLAEGSAAVRGTATGDEGDSGLAPQIDWGVYGPAVQRWAGILGRPAPAPTDDQGHLAPEFVEWMLGYPAGWFDVDGVSRTQKLRALGNSVQIQAAQEVGLWLVDLVEWGLLPNPTVIQKPDP